VPGEILIKFKSGASPASVRAALSAQDARAIGEIPALDVQRLRVPEEQELAIIASLQHHPLVEYVEPNYIIHAVLTPNDAYFSSHQWNLSKIGALQAWDVTTGSSDITIAIVDSGIDLDHPDLSGKIILGYDYVNEDWDPDDDYGHGTHVAGIAAAWTNNTIGVAGVSWGARLMALKVLNAGGTGSYDDVASAVTYAADNGAKIINLSLGGGSDSETLRDAVIYAHNKGCVVVVATGNDNGPVLYPAKYTEAFAVAATASSDQRYWLSNYGPEVDIAAPGVSIYSTHFGGGYTYKSGTSMATPHVAGLAALVWSACPGYTNDQVESRIEATAADLGVTGWDQYYGHGRIDAYAALLCAPNLGASPQSIAFLADDNTDPIPSSQAVSVLSAGCDPITWTVTISPSGTTWLAATPLSGMAEEASPGSLSLSADKSGLGHGTYNAQLVISTTRTEVWDNPQTVDVRLTYVEKLSQMILLLIFKNYSW
jgi:thermitase